MRLQALINQSLATLIYQRQLRKFVFCDRPVSHYKWVINSLYTDKNVTELTDVAAKTEIHVIKTCVAIAIHCQPVSLSIAKIGPGVTEAQEAVDSRGTSPNSD